MKKNIDKNWHPTKNLPLQFDFHLDKKENYWWTGECGHEWEATLNYQRLAKDDGCLICLGYIALTDFNDLNTTHPVFATEWHPTKNGEVSPDKVTAKSNNKVWWLCLNNHTWKSSPSERAGKGIKCDICEGNTLLAGFNDLTTRNPVLATEWHPTKNGKITPQQISINSTSKVWWLGTCGHEWKSSPRDRVRTASGCTVCLSGRNLLVGFNDLASVNPVLASEWHPTKNGKITPQQISIGAHTKIWWICSEGHEWQVSPIYRLRNEVISKCPICVGRNLHEGFNDFASRYPILASEWHPTKNGKLYPQKINAGSNKKVWWIGVCGHEWHTSTLSRIAGSGCPICSGQKVLTGFNDLATTHPALAAEWHPTKNGELIPEQFSIGSHTKVWWRCAKGHEWQMTTNYRTALKANCSICEGRVVLAGFNDLATTHPTLAAEWHPTKNKKLTPEQIRGNSNRKIWWLGECGHEWIANALSRSKGAGCPVCK